MLEASCVKCWFSELPALERKAGRAVSLWTRWERTRRKHPGLGAPGPGLGPGFSGLTMSKSRCLSFIRISEMREWTKSFPGFSSSSEIQVHSPLRIRRRLRVRSSAEPQSLPHCRGSFVREPFHRALQYWTGALLHCTHIQQARAFWLSDRR